MIHQKRQQTEQFTDRTTTEISLKTIFIRDSHFFNLFVYWFVYWREKSASIFFIFSAGKITYATTPHLKAISEMTYGRKHGGNSLSFFLSRNYKRRGKIFLIMPASLFSGFRFKEMDKLFIFSQIPWADNDLTNWFGSFVSTFIFFIIIYGTRQKYTFVLQTISVS